MSEAYLIGIDIGTQGTKTALYSKSGKEVAAAFEASRLISPSAGVVEQDPSEIYASVIHTVREVMQTSGVLPKQVKAIGLDGQMAGIMGVDKDFNAVTNYDSWLDMRCGKYIEEIKKMAEEKVISITGCPVTYAHGAKILWWKNERPRTYERIAKFVMPTTYVVGRMTGLKADAAYIDYTHIHFSGFADTENLCWSEELLELFGVQKEKLPEIVEPWKVVGRLTKEVGDACGLVGNIPVVAGCGDSAASSLGAGITEKGMIFDVAGTASIFSCCVDQFRPDTENKTIVFPRSVIKGLWIPLAYISGGGMCLKWFRDNINGGHDSFVTLDAEAEDVMPGSGNLLFLPHFNGRTCPNDEKVLGTWIGLSFNHERKHLYHSIMEAIAYEYRYYLKTLRKLLGDVEFKNVIAIGGGAKSKLFNLIKADVLGIPYTGLQISETATLASAIIAGYGVGVYTDLAQTVNAVVAKRDDVIVPDRKHHLAYSKYADLYEELFDSLQSTFDTFHQKLNSLGDSDA